MQAGLFMFMCDVITVSYTHLDVYKRQIHVSIELIFKLLKINTL